MPTQTSPEPITRLQRLHSRLEREIDSERALRQPDPARLSRLKKFKLAVKDRLTFHRGEAPDTATA